jgi:ribosomal protein S18 acetylase RimI-like enzyme
MELKIIEADVSFREKIKSCQFKNHLEISVNNENEKELQIKDLPNDFPQLFSDELFIKGKNWILSDGENVYGCISVFPKENGVGFLNNFSVDKELRGKKYGLKLFNEAMDYARKNYDSIELITLPIRMASAVNMYEKEGFKVLKEINNDPYIIWLMCINFK